MIVRPKHRGARTRVASFLQVVQSIEASLVNIFPRPLREMILIACPASVVEIENLSIRKVTSYLDLMQIPHSLDGESIDEDLAGFILFRRRHGLIFTEQSGSNGFRAFTLAHELGHFWEFWNKAKTENVSYEKRDQPQNLQEKLNYEEFRANHFAAELLMPIDSVALLASNYAGDQLLEEMIKMFGVSEVAAQIRLKEFGLL
jgi:Zn-dependent peptidase ImmA (M78 family)